jgi:hypothetical protein
MHDAALVVDDPLGGETGYGPTYKRPGSPEHVRERVMRQWEIVTIQSIARKQQAASQPLLHSMNAVTARGSNCFVEQTVRVSAHAGSKFREL